MNAVIVPVNNSLLYGHIILPLSFMIMFIPHYHLDSNFPLLRISYKINIGDGKKKKGGGDGWMEREETEKEHFCDLTYMYV